MEQLADKGNGNYAYIDDMLEAKKVFVNEFGGTLFTIAKDVKLQLEFNPAIVKSYRLIGYENRVLASEDFNDDKKDAGELGSGHSVTALYEIIPVGSKEISTVDQLKYQQTKPAESASKNELLTVKFRYKKPDQDNSNLIISVLENKDIAFERASDRLQFISSVAEFGMLLQDSEHRKNSSFQSCH